MPEGIQGSTSEARLLNDERFLRKISYMYYEEGHSQEAIATMEYCSRPTISKALQKAKDRGIVRISIVPDVRTGYLRNLSREVRTQLGLEDLILVAGRNMNAVAAHNQLDEVVTEIASAAADYLDQLLNDSDILAISGGRTFMRNVIRYLKPTRALPHMQVVATIGFVESRTSFGDANLIAYDLAEAYGANHLWFPCPAFFPDEDLVERTRQLPIIKDAYEMMTRANVVVTGLWTPHTNQDMIKRGILTSEQVTAIEAYRPVVDINHWVFDAFGRCINETLKPFPYTLSGLEIPSLKERIQRGNTKVILVAGGGPSYVSAIRATLRAGLANILITDHITAQLLLIDN
ncbi:MAG: DNA-binding transcriptional regulator [Ktedonobacteraceae bacterium]|nr:DNA-binding transcriptional regulator [Ktedonobacteraceae bacterium]MBO0796243.1 DNA-binding transcriptional regulator [Ktedonobacteraceae bacterium]